MRAVSSFCKDDEGLINFFSQRRTFDWLQQCNDSKTLVRWLRENYDFKGESKQFLFQSFKQRTQHVHFILHFPQYLKKKVSNHILVRFRFHIVSLHSCPDPSCNISSVQNFIIKEDGRKMADTKALSFHFFSQKLLFKIRN